MLKLAFTYYAHYIIHLFNFNFIPHWLLICLLMFEVFIFYKNIMFLVVSLYIYYIEDLNI